LYSSYSHIGKPTFHKFEFIVSQILAFVKK
jgi:hypothetical protein